ncbi:hypothetical protein ACFQVA_32745 [Actinomadura keratinilytica]
MALLRRPWPRTSASAPEAETSSPVRTWRSAPSTMAARAARHRS